MSRYLIGIDLGTTNSALAFVDSKHKGQAKLESFEVPQLVAPGEVAERALLPSFLYLPGPHDLPPAACALPWDAARNYAVGEFARNHGARVPGRLVTSAKSWLCHAGVDRTAAILPWSAPPDVPRISPVEASARYLRHFAEAWNHVMAADRPENRFENQQIVLTVPASFDDVARNLTVEAARQAGIENLTLLEEPQAAFYAWLAGAGAGSQESGVRSQGSGNRSQKSGVRGQERRTPGSWLLAPGMMCLVVDVGGGTSDFSLIQAVEQKGDLGFVRQAVGDHLLLGGDNMDLALAKYVESKLPNPARLDAASFGMLTQACRLAKETILAPDAPAEYTVTVMGRGRQVVGGAQHARLTSEEVRKVIFDGFFPATAVDAEPARGARVGLHEMGLPYVSDPAITRHLAAFLRQHQITSERPPDAILFNGGVFQPLAMRERLLDVLRQWYDKRERPWQPAVLANASLDLAVAWGAAHYGWLRHTGGRRITGGLARSYYIAVGAAEGEALDGESEAPAEPTAEGQARSGSAGASPSRPLALLCVVPQHLEEGSEITLDKPELELALGQPVTFPLYTSTVRGDDKAGEMLQVAAQQLLQLPPLHTILRGGKRSGTKHVPVKLAARLTEIGTLELWCVARNSDNRWRLEFNLRESVKEWERGGVREPESESGTAGDDSPPRSYAPTDVWPEDQVQAAAQVIRAAYADKTEQAARDLTKSLEAALDTSRQSWPTGLCRRLWDFLAEVAEQRRLSPAHLSRWYNLAGYCLRPGFGDSLDKFRVEQLWKLLHSTAKQQPVGQTFVPARVSEGGADVWIMWRRVAGGLNASLQQSLLERLRPVLLPSKTGKGPPYKPGTNELAEMWRTAASLERLDPKIKEPLGQAILKQLRRSPSPTYAFWALTRLGSRGLLYGPLNCIVHPQIAEGWLAGILPFQAGNHSERQAWLFCLSQLARRTGQRALDVSEETRQRVIDCLQTQAAPSHLVQMVEKGGELESAEQKQFFGESLPIGLRLASAEE